MKYKLTFPSLDSANWLHGTEKAEVIKTLRDFCPLWGLKGAKDIVDQSGIHRNAITYVVDVSIEPAESDTHLAALRTLRNYGIEVEWVASMDEPEPEIWRPVKTDTLADLRTVAIAALDRGEHDIAIALIELIKKNS
jgi:hypothetical protein